MAPLSMSFTAIRADGARISTDGKFAALTVTTEPGDRLVLGFLTPEALDQAIDALNEARRLLTVAGAPKPETVILKPVRTVAVWTPEEEKMRDMVGLAFDRSFPERQGFLLAPAVARDLAKRLVVASQFSSSVHAPG